MLSPKLNDKKANFSFSKGSRGLFLKNKNEKIFIVYDSIFLNIT